MLVSKYAIIMKPYLFRKIERNILMSFQTSIRSAYHIDDDEVTSHDWPIFQTRTSYGKQTFLLNGYPDLNPAATVIRESATDKQMKQTNQIGFKTRDVVGTTLLLHPAHYISTMFLLLTDTNLICNWKP